MKRIPCAPLLSVLLVLGCAGRHPIEGRDGSSAAVQSRPAPGAPPQLAAETEPTSLTRVSLAQALDRGERMHPDLAAANARVEAADGRVLQAGLYPNPRAVARIESAPLDGRTARDAEYVGGVSLPLLLPGRLSTARAAEEREREALLEQAHAMRLEVCARIRGAFAAGLFAQETVRAHEEALQSAEAGVAVERALLASGDAVPADVARAEIEIVRTRLDLERAKSLREAALADLAAAMGEAGTRIRSIDGTIEEALQIPALESLSARIASHPLLRAAEADIAAKRARIELAEAQRIPEVNLDLLYRRLGASEQNAFDIGISVPISIFDRNRGRIREAEADLDAAYAEARSLRNTLAATLQEAHVRLSHALAAAKVLRDDMLPRTEIVLESAEARFAAGDTSLTDVLIARRDRAGARLSYLESLRDVMQAWAGLSRYCETPPPPNVSAAR